MAKIDLVVSISTALRAASSLAALVKAYGRDVRHFVISAIGGDGCRDLVFAVMEYLEQQRELQSHENVDRAE